MVSRSPKPVWPNLEQWFEEALSHSPRTVTSWHVEAQSPVPAPCCQPAAQPPKPPALGDMHPVTESPPGELSGEGMLVHKWTTSLCSLLIPVGHGWVGSAMGRQTACLLPIKCSSSHTTHSCNFFLNKNPFEINYHFLSSWKLLNNCLQGSSCHTWEAEM